MEIKVKKLHEAAKLPVFAHDTDAGMDLFAVAEVVIKPGERVQVPTGLALAIPNEFVGLLWDKSGISHQRGLKTLGGVIDSGYRGEILVGLVNVGTEAQTLKIGEKVTQMLIQRIARPTMVEVDELDDTSRGDGAFGSTGS